MGFAPTWLRQATPPPASHNHFNHCRQDEQRADVLRQVAKNEYTGMSFVSVGMPLYIKNTRVEKYAIFDRNRRLFRKRYEINPWLL